MCVTLTRTRFSVLSPLVSNRTTFLKRIFTCLPSNDLILSETPAQVKQATTGKHVNNVENKSRRCVRRAGMVGGRSAERTGSVGFWGIRGLAASRRAAPHRLLTVQILCELRSGRHHSGHADKGLAHGTRREDGAALRSPFSFNTRRKHSRLLRAARCHSGRRGTAYDTHTPTAIAIY